jgi:hypothetical protein
MSALQYVMAGVGALALLMGLAMLVKRIRTIASGCKVEATVVDEKVEISRSKSGKVIRVSTQVFEFAHEGKKYRCQSSVVSSGNGYPPGLKIEVRYLPQDPKATAEVDSFMAFFGFPVIALVVGAAFIWIATQ